MLSNEEINELFGYRPKKKILPIRERLFNRIRKVGSCWVYEGNTNHDGYGIIGLGNKAYLAHRMSWVIHNGPIPIGMCVCHSCDNPPCVHPDHLWLGTIGDNMSDAKTKGRLTTPPIHYGTDNINNKLDENQVHEIRKRYRDGGITKIQIGRDFGVSFTAIDNILRGRTWAHVK